MKKIGISAEEIKRRALTIHSWLLDVALATSKPEYRIAKAGLVYTAGTGRYRA
jgi:hypothetical protein